MAGKTSRQAETEQANCGGRQRKGGRNGAEEPGKKRRRNGARVEKTRQARSEVAER